MDESAVKRILPHSIEAERAVIGSMMMDADAISVAAEVLTSDDFYQHQYGILFETMAQMYQAGKPVDLVTLQDELKSKDVPEELYSLEFITNLLNSEATSANIKYYANIVAEKALLRRMIRANEEVANMCYQDKEPIDSILEQTEKTIFDLVQRKSSDDYVPIKQVVLNVIDKIEAAAKLGGTVTGISTGFYDLDYKTSGLQPSDLVLIAARPSMGKTAFVLNLAQFIAVRNKVTTAIFSLEMSREQLVNRILSMESGVDSQSMRNGKLSGRRLGKACGGCRLYQ